MNDRPSLPEELTSQLNDYLKRTTGRELVCVICGSDQYRSDSDEQSITVLGTGEQRLRVRVNVTCLICGFMASFDLKWRNLDETHPP